MMYHVGDQIVHCNYGLGVITQIDEKRLDGLTVQYYVVRIRDLTIWVPASEVGEHSLRYPTPPGDFEALFSILTSPGEALPEDRLLRKTQLSDQLRDGKLSSFCQAIRDLTFQRRTKKLNENDKDVMVRAQSFLLMEWAHSLSVTFGQAGQHLNTLFGEEVCVAKEPANRNSSLPSAWR